MTGLRQALVTQRFGRRVRRLDWAGSIGEFGET
jgi:hypothetical protein